MARISPVWGFMTIVTPWLTFASRMPHSSDSVAIRWRRASMVRTRLRPATGARVSSRTFTSRPEASRSHRADPYSPRSVVFEGGLDPGAADGVVVEVALVGHARPAPRR